MSGTTSSAPVLVLPNWLMSLVKSIFPNNSPSLLNLNDSAPPASATMEWRTALALLILASERRNADNAADCFCHLASG